MSKELEKIYMDNQSYQKFLAEIASLEKLLIDNNRQKGEAYSGSSGDGWHDNFAFDEVNRNERMIAYKINEYKEMLSRIVIVDKLEDENIIEIGDIVTVNITDDYGDDELEFILVGGYAEFDNSDIRNISVNSPLGMSVYHKHVGDNTYYEVNNRRLDVKILAKRNTKEKEFIKK